jgi:hypothetical protein
MMKFFLVLFSAVVFNTLSGVPAFAQVSNGGFESDAVGAGQWQYVMGAVRDNSKPRSGLFAANLNNTSQAQNTNVQQQTLNGTILAGTDYTFTFFAQAEYGVSGIGQAQVAFLNSAGGILPGSPQFINIGASQNYVEYTQNFTAPANASALFLGFNAVTGAVAGASSHVYIDDVRFTAIPEPTSACLLGLAGLCFVVSRWRSRSSTEVRIKKPLV